MRNQPQRQAASKPAEQDKAGRRARQIVTLGTVVAVVGCFAFNYGNVLQLGIELDVHPLIAGSLPPAVDATLVAGLVGERYLSNKGVDGRALRPARWMTLVSGLMVFGLNVALALVQRNWGAAVYDAVPSLLLIGWAALYPWFLRQFDAVDRVARNQQQNDSGSPDPDPEDDEPRESRKPRRRKPATTDPGGGKSDRNNRIFAAVRDLAVAGELTSATAPVERARLVLAQAELTGEVKDSTARYQIDKALEHVTLPSPATVDETSSVTDAADNGRVPTGVAG